MGRSVSIASDIDVISVWPLIAQHLEFNPKGGDTEPSEI